MEQYRQTFEQALERNSEDTEKWEIFKKELEETKKNLNEFVKSHSLDIMVPMGKKALIRGKLQHTNEITVSHGNGIFSDCSQIQAIEILNHRLNTCTTRLRALEAERNLYRNKLELPKNEDVFGTEEGEEIIEDYDENVEQEWRRKHAESVKKQKQLEAAERAETNIENKEVGRMLEDYELMEELADELDNLQMNGDSAETLAQLLSGKLSIPDPKPRIAHDMKEISTHVEHKKPLDAKGLKNIGPLIEKSYNLEDPESTMKTFPEMNNNHTAENGDVVNLLKSYRSKLKDILKSITRDDEKNLNVYLDLCELKDEIEDDIQILNGNEIYSSEDDNSEKDSDDDNTLSLNTNINDPSEKHHIKRKVRFSSVLENVKIIENKEDSLKMHSEKNLFPILIEIQHSENIFTSSQNIEDVISSPADIYNKFHNTSVTKLDSTVKKSILKATSPLADRAPIKKSAEAPEKTVKKIYKSDIMGEVVEHNSEVSQPAEEVILINSKNDAPKKISKFKQMRQQS